MHMYVHICMYEGVCKAMLSCHEGPCHNKNKVAAVPGD